MSLHKSLHKCAILVDEIDNRLICCVSVRDFEQKILIKGVHLTNYKKNCLIESWFFSHEERYTYYESIKKTIKCHRTTFYSIFNIMSWNTRNS